MPEIEYYPVRKIRYLPILLSKDNICWTIFRNYILTNLLGSGNRICHLAWVSLSAADSVAHTLKRSPIRAGLDLTGVGVSTKGQTQWW